ncbi:MAG TPA: COX15/CtaA family protein [Acidobacteriaceae bacterium]|nr:COX15/CtaA family protein [Acidobacteriaceae bacterium]
MRDASAVSSPQQVWLARFAWFAVFYNIAVTIWGAFVRASGSGAGCGNHWPLCNGQVIPVSPGFHTIVEFTHRQMTTGLSLVVIALLVWTFRATSKRNAARFFSIASLVLLLNEALLGALLVKLGYVTDNQSPGRAVMMSIHFSNTLLLLTALTLTARFLSVASPRECPWLARARGFGWAAAGLAATFVTGISGSTAALGDTLYPPTSLSAAFAQDYTSGTPLLLRLRVVHPIAALLAAAFVVWLILRSRDLAPTAAELNPVGRRRLAGFTRRANIVIVLLALQFALGIADILLLAPAWIQLLHLLGADLYWVALVLLAAETVWPTMADHTTASESQAATADVV